MKAKRIWVFLVFLCFFATAFAQQAQAQKIPTVVGSWTAATRMPDKNVDEKWTIKQTADKVTGTVNRDGMDYTFVGTIDDVGFFRVDIKVGDMTYKVRATVDRDTKDVMDGSILIGGKEYVWGAKLSKGK